MATKAKANTVTNGATTDDSSPGVGVVWVDGDWRWGKKPVALEDLIVARLRTAVGRVYAVVKQIDAVLTDDDLSAFDWSARGPLESRDVAEDELERALNTVGSFMCEVENFTPGDGFPDDAPHRPTARDDKDGPADRAYSTVQEMQDAGNELLCVVEGFNALRLLDWSGDVGYVPSNFDTVRRALVTVGSVLNSTGRGIELPFRRDSDGF